MPLLLIALVEGGAAQTLYGKPVYDPAPKSYFELILVDTTKYSYRNSPDVTWDVAENLAKTSVYKGVHGRLAVIKSLSTHEFLLLTFKPNNTTWIGLRYWCSTRTLQFADETYWTQGMFQAWGAKWDGSGLPDPCDEWHSYQKPQYMPVAYLSVPDGFRWLATGWHKAYYSYFVEYPTGQP